LGGGGGGGHFGGGGGGGSAFGPGSACDGGIGGGAGGGSSFVDRARATESRTTEAVQLGDGKISITWTKPAGVSSNVQSEAIDVVSDCWD
jgi:hypothetical protein